MDTGSTDAGGSHDAAEEGRSLRFAATLTACLGGVHALLFLLSYWLLSDVPGPPGEGH